MSMKVTREEFLGVTYDELLDENATLRQQLADVTESMGRVEERHAKTFEVGKRWMAKAARFEAENIKLRELAKDMYKALFSLNLDHCQACPREDACVFMHKSFDCDECAFERDMRELGVDE